MLPGFQSWLSGLAKSSVTTFLVSYSCITELIKKNTVVLEKNYHIVGQLLMHHSVNKKILLFWKKNKQKNIHQSNLIKFNKVNI